MTWFRVGGAGVPVSLKNGMNAVFNKKFGTSGQNYPPNQWPDDVNLLGPLPEKTVAGAIAHTDDAADTVPVKSVICSIVPKQAGTGTPSPTNPRAISGYTELTISQRGKNLMQNKTYQRTANILRLGTDTLDGRLSLKANTYTISITSDVAIGSLTYTIGETSTNITFTSSGTRYYGSFTLSADTNDIFIHVYKSGGITAENISDIMLEVGSSATSFEAYNAAADISDSWSSIGAILGGERDLTEGTLKSDMAKDTMSSSYLSGLGSGYIAFDASVPAMNNHPAIWVRNWNYSQMPTFRPGGIKCAINSFPDVHINDSSIMSTQYRVYIDVNGLNITSVQDFIDAVAAMEQNGDSLEIAYELATPTEYSNLDTYDFETLYAVNNFYSDIEGGQTQVTYRQDIALALQAVSSSRGLMMASRPVTQLVGEESDPDQVNELVEDDDNNIREQLNEVVENDETEQEGENDAR